MKLKGNTIINLYETFNKLANKELDLNTACIIAKNIQELSNPKKIIDEKRNIFINEYAKKNNDGTIKSKDAGIVEWDNEALFIEKMNELLNSEVEINLNSITKSSLLDIKLSAIDILILTESNLLIEDKAE